MALDLDNKKYIATPQFYSKSVYNPARSKAEGRPIYEEKEFVRILIAGDRHFEPVFPAHSMWLRADFMTADALGVNPGDEVTYAQRWPEQYRRFKEGNIQAASGTPLEALGLPVNRIAELKAIKIFTVEALAALEYKSLRAAGPAAQKEKELAQSFLDRTTNFAMVTADRRENDDLKAQMEAMRKQLKDLQDQQRLASAAADAAPAPSVPKYRPVAEAQDWEPEPEEEDSHPDLTDSDLKDRIEALTGAKPRGNPSRRTLLHIYDTASEKEAAA